MTDLPTLMRKLESASGADRELDCLLTIALEYPEGIIHDRKVGSIETTPGAFPPRRVAELTGSVDAALALAVRVKTDDPSWWVVFLEIALREVAYAHTLAGPKPGPDALARAILADLVRTLIHESTHE